MQQAEPKCSIVSLFKIETKTHFFHYLKISDAVRNKLKVVFHVEALHVIIAKMRLDMLLELFKQNVLRVKLAAHRANLNLGE